MILNSHWGLKTDVVYAEFGMILQLREASLSLSTAIINGSEFLEKPVEEYPLPTVTFTWINSLTKEWTVEQENIIQYMSSRTV